MEKVGIMKKVLLVICSIIGVVIVCKFGFEENNPGYACYSTDTRQQLG